MHRLLGVAFILFSLLVVTIATSEAGKAAISSEEIKLSLNSYAGAHPSIAGLKHLSTDLSSKRTLEPVSTRSSQRDGGDFSKPRILPLLYVSLGSFFWRSLF